MQAGVPFEDHPVVGHEAVDLSVAIASKLLQRHVSKADNERLIEDTFRQLESTKRPS